jgi:hypothetical protein
MGLRDVVDQMRLQGMVAGGEGGARLIPVVGQTVPDMQLQEQIDDMRQQGMSEKQIQVEISRQAEIEATALSMIMPVEGLALKGTAAVVAWRTARLEANAVKAIKAWKVALAARGWEKAGEVGKLLDGDLGREQLSGAPTKLIEPRLLRCEGRV